MRCCLDLYRSLYLSEKRSCKEDGARLGDEARRDSEVELSRFRAGSSRLTRGCFHSHLLLYGVTLRRCCRCCRVKEDAGGDGGESEPACARGLPASRALNLHVQVRSIHFRHFLTLEKLHKPRSVRPAHRRERPTSSCARDFLRSSIASSDTLSRVNERKYQLPSNLRSLNNTLRDSTSHHFDVMLVLWATSACRGRS